MNLSILRYKRIMLDIVIVSNIIRYILRLSGDHPWLAARRDQNVAKRVDTKEVLKCETGKCVRDKTAV